MNAGPSATATAAGTSAVAAPAPAVSAADVAGASGSSCGTAPDLPPALCDMTVADMIAATPLGPILDRPVCEVLSTLGLPTLPAAAPLPPLPGLPPLPALDIDMLVKPLTDLLGGFGTGDLAGAGHDPSQIFAGLSGVLDTTISLASTALGTVDELWTGQAATAATAKGVQAGADTAALSTQGTGISIDIQAAAAIVGAGLAAVQGIIAATVTKIVATLPIIMTPPGQGMAVAFAAEGLAEGAAVVAATRAQLLAPTAQMTAHGAPVPVTGAPAAGVGPSPFAIAGSVLDGIAPLLGAVAQVPASVSGMLPGGLDGSADLIDPAPTRSCAVDGDPEGTAVRPASAGAGAGVGGSGVGLSGAGSAMAAPALRGAGVTGIPLGGTEPASAAGPLSAVKVAGGPTMPLAGGAAPMAAAGAARGVGGSSDSHEISDYLVSADNGRRVVGESADVAPAVFGDTPIVRDPIADIRLRLGAAVAAGDAIDDHETEGLS